MNEGIGNGELQDTEKQKVEKIGEQLMYLGGT